MHLTDWKSEIHLVMFRKLHLVMFRKLHLVMFRKPKAREWCSENMTCLPQKLRNPIAESPTGLLKTRFVDILECGEIKCGNRYIRGDSRRCCSPLLANEQMYLCQPPASRSASSVLRIYLMRSTHRQLHRHV
jgi:hypothetical protein